MSRFFRSFNDLFTGVKRLRLEFGSSLAAVKNLHFLRYPKSALTLFLPELPNETLKFMSAPPTKIALIVAASENNVIGINDDLPWRLSADLKRFKALTMGHAIIMGRKTFDSIGRLLPGRQTVIVTRNQDFHFEGATVVHSIEAAMEACCEHEIAFLTGGAEIYRLGLSLVDEIYLTRVHTEIDGDTFLPAIDWEQFELVETEAFKADDKNEFDFSLSRYRKRTD